MDPQLESELFSLYNEFCSFGAGHKLDGQLLMDSRNCQKLARDCGICDGKYLTRTDVDLIFTKVKARGSHKIDFNEFLECTRQWADKKGISHEELLEMLLSTPGPTLNHVTEPDYSKFTESPSVLSDDFMQKLNITNEEEQFFDQVAEDQQQQQPQEIDEGYYENDDDNNNNNVQQQPTLHPDWYVVANPQPLGPGEEVYYVNKFTNQTSWDFPSINVPPNNNNNTKNNRSSSLKPNQQKSTTTTSTSFIISPGNRSIKSNDDHMIAHNNSNNNRSHLSEQSTTRSDGSPYKSVFDKLTDPQLYTGTHKLRFDPNTGRGRGKAGRDSPAKSAKSTFGIYSGTSPRGSFKGNTNTGTDQVITDIAEVLTRR
jgi:hypothetical protein